MTERKLIELGFEKQIDKSDESKPFYYYTLDVTPGLSFITQASDEVKNGEWVVEIFNASKIKFTNPKTLSTLIEILNNNKDE